VEARQATIGDTMNKAKKAWTWVKHHWYVPVLLILVVVFASLENGIKNKFYELLVKTRANYKKEIDTINKGKENEKEEKDKILAKHKEAVDKIEKDFDIELAKLEEDKQREVSELIEKFQDKPDELAKEIASLLGARHVE
jgi:hypothetical protein